MILTERQARGLTQKDVALSAGLHTMTLSKIERGIQGDVGVETLCRLATVFSMAGSGLLATAERWQRELAGRRVPKSAARIAAYVLLNKR